MFYCPECGRGCLELVNNKGYSFRLEDTYVTLKYDFYSRECSICGCHPMNWDEARELHELLLKSKDL